MSSIPFYETPNGQILLCEANYPLGIKSYLRAEKMYVDTISRHYTHIVEIGCIDGRYSYLGRESDKRYTGVDLNITSIVKGQATNYNPHSVLVHQAALPFLEEWAPTFTTSTLVLFPFNSLGNMIHREEIVAVLKQNKVDFLISTYTTTTEALKARKVYYDLSVGGYAKVSEQKDEVRFTSSCGLDSTTISLGWLKDALFGTLVRQRSNLLGSIGVAHLVLVDT
jgi:hypothetical protein